MVKMRNQPLYLKICIIAVAVAAILMIFFNRSGGGLFNFKNLFLVTWMIIMVVGLVSGLKKWVQYAKEYIRKRSYTAMMVHIGILILILGVCFALVSGLIKAIWMNM